MGVSEEVYEQIEGLIEGIIKLEREMLKASPLKFDQLFTEQWVKKLQIKQLLEES